MMNGTTAAGSGGVPRTNEGVARIVCGEWRDQAADLRPDADAVPAWLDKGVGVIDLGDIKGADRAADGNEGIAW